MSRPSRTRVAVIIASIEASRTVRASVGRYLEEVGDRGEVVLADASRDGTADEAARLFPGLRVLRRPPGSLAPELWRDGLRATDAPLVAFTTAQMVPDRGWLSMLVSRLKRTGAAGVGGPIEPSDRLSPVDRAIFLLRYAPYLRPLPSTADEPPGDNSLYRRECLEPLESTWDRGFWEVEVHRALRARGERLAMAERAAVEFLGGSPFPSALRQRLDHARQYGASRARTMGRGERLARAAAAPLVPAVLIRRIFATLAARGRPIGPWLPALPSLSLLLAAWSAGEAGGTWLGPAGPVSDAA